MFKQIALNKPFNPKSSFVSYTDTNDWKTLKTLFWHEDLMKTLAPNCLQTIVFIGSLIVFNEDFNLRTLRSLVTEWHKVFKKLLKPSEYIFLAMPIKWKQI
jgi:hypothetical protein